MVKKGTISISDVANELGHGKDFVFDIGHLERALENKFNAVLHQISIGDCLFFEYNDKRTGEVFGLEFEVKDKTWYCDDGLWFTIFVNLVSCD